MAGLEKEVVSPILDIKALGERCPMPLLLMRRGLRRVEVGQQLRVTVSDSASVGDFLSFIDLTEHRLVSYACQNGVHTYVIARGA